MALTGFRVASERARDTAGGRTDVGGGCLSDTGRGSTGAHA